MLTSLLGRCIGLWTVVCVLLLFFFPLAHGNFQSTHGPVTALRAVRSVVTIFLSIMLAALQVFAVTFPSAFWPAFRLTEIGSGRGMLPPAGSGSILRC